jgi:hypothetical protein
MKQMWDNRYAAEPYAYGTEPNVFLKEKLAQYALSGKLLMPAEGEGRNAVYAASQNIAVFAFDISEKGRAKAIKLANEHQVEINYNVGDFLKMDYIDNSFDGAALIYAHFPLPLLSVYHQKISHLIKPGGLVILEGFSKNNLPLREANPDVGGPNNVEMLFSKNSILDDFPNFEVLELEEATVDLKEGLYHNGKAKVIRFVGRKQ